MTKRHMSLLLAAVLELSCPMTRAQDRPDVREASTASEQIRQLSRQVMAAEQHVQDSQKELAGLKARLAELELALAPATPTKALPNPFPPTNSADTKSVDAVSMEATQLATLDQIKVETSSKFPLRVNGLILLTAGVNSSGVDSPTDPTASLGGSGSTALSLRQTILGLDAVGPHLGHAHSSADIRVDFSGNQAANSYPTAGGLLRLRTAHASLDWQHARVFFSLDRTLLNPNTPSSLVQVAQPGLSWSGNLWNWSPQLGVSSHFGARHLVVLEGAWISPPDAPYPAMPYSSSRSEPASLSEASRAPGVEARVAFESGDRSRGLRLGVGGYFAPHRLPGVGSFNSWAATVDFRQPLGRRADFSGSLYRGAGLGGLGAGGYKDWVSASAGLKTYLYAPDDVGGWTQLTIHLSPTLDWNNAFGMDDVFAGQLRSLSLSTAGYGSIARNRTVTSNLLWSPRPYLPFSFEYRRLYTAPVAGPLWNTNVFAFGGGYRF